MKLSQVLNSRVKDWQSLIRGLCEVCSLEREHPCFFGNWLSQEIGPSIDLLLGNPSFMSNNLSRSFLLLKTVLNENDFHKWLYSSNRMDALKKERLSSIDKIQTVSKRLYDNTLNRDKRQRYDIFILRYFVNNVHTNKNIGLLPKEIIYHILDYALIDNVTIDLLYPMSHTGCSAFQGKPTGLLDAIRSHISVEQNFTRLDKRGGLRLSEEQKDQEVKILQLVNSYDDDDEIQLFFNASQDELDSLERLAKLVHEFVPQTQYEYRSTPYDYVKSCAYIIEFLEEMSTLKGIDLTIDKQLAYQILFLKHIHYIADRQAYQLTNNYFQRLYDNNHYSRWEFFEMINSITILMLGNMTVGLMAHDNEKALFDSNILLSKCYSNTGSWPVAEKLPFKIFNDNEISFNSYDDQVDFYKLVATEIFRESLCRAFNLFDINRFRTLDFTAFTQKCDELVFPVVPELQHRSSMIMSYLGTAHGRIVDFLHELIPMSEYFSNHSYDYEKLFIHIIPDDYGRIEASEFSNLVARRRRHNILLYYSLLSYLILLDVPTRNINKHISFILKGLRDHNNVVNHVRIGRETISISIDKSINHAHREYRYYNVKKRLPAIKVLTALVSEAFNNISIMNKWRDDDMLISLTSDFDSY